MKDQRLLELAISGLEAQRDRIEEELSDLRGRISSKPAAKKAKAVAADEPTKKRKMSPAKRRAISERMKLSWAARKKAEK